VDLEEQLEELAFYSDLESEEEFEEAYEDIEPLSSVLRDELEELVEFMKRYYFHLWLQPASHTADKDEKNGGAELMELSTGSLIPQISDRKIAWVAYQLGIHPLHVKHVLSDAVEELKLYLIESFGK
jgi:hypothetical protein